MPLAVPPPLAPGDVVAVVAPSSPFPSHELWRGLAWLRTRYRIRIQPGVLSRSGYLAGDDARRRDELAGAMLHGDVKAIAVARGGYGALRILADLPWKEFSRRPRWIVGFSDATALHAMAWAAGVASVHGPNVTGLGRDAPALTRYAWIESMERPGAAGAWRGLRVVRGGTATGPLLGGNLTLLHAMAAAGRLQLPVGCIVALEDVGEAPYRVDRMLTSLVLGGHLAGAAALVFGSFEKCLAGRDGRTVDDVMDDCAGALGVPVVAGAPFGHGARNEAFVTGRPALLAGDTLTWRSGAE